MMSQDLLARIVALKVETEKTWKFFANWYPETKKAVLLELWKSK